MILLTIILNKQVSYDAIQKNTIVLCVCASHKRAAAVVKMPKAPRVEKHLPERRSSRIAESTCCVCLEPSFQQVSPFVCKHRLCVGCREHGIRTCPFCRAKEQVVPTFRELKNIYGVPKSSSICFLLTVLMCDFKLHVGKAVHDIMDVCGPFSAYNNRQLIIAVLLWFRELRSANWKPIVEGSRMFVLADEVPVPENVMIEMTGLLCERHLS